MISEDLKIKQNILEWDVEYWQSFVIQYERGDFGFLSEGSKEFNDYQECLHELHKSENRLNHFKKQNASELI